MSWELTIVNASDRARPLGSQEALRKVFSSALPGVSWELAPGPSPAAIEQMPDELREHFLKHQPQLNAGFESGDLSIQFYTTDSPVIQEVGVEVRGRGNPIPALAALCTSNGWAAIENMTALPIDLSAADSADWKEFERWRDRAIESLASPGRCNGQ